MPLPDSKPEQPDNTLIDNILNQESDSLSKVSQIEKSSEKQLSSKIPTSIDTVEEPNKALPDAPAQKTVEFDRSNQEDGDSQKQSGKTPGKSLSMETRSTSMASDTSEREIPSTTPRSDPGSPVQDSFIVAETASQLANSVVDLMTQSIYLPNEENFDSIEETTQLLTDRSTFSTMESSTLDSQTYESEASESASSKDSSKLVFTEKQNEVSIQNVVKTEAKTISEDSSLSSTLEVSISSESKMQAKIGYVSSEQISEQKIITSESVSTISTTKIQSVESKSEIVEKCIETKISTSLQCSSVEQNESSAENRNKEESLNSIDHLYENGDKCQTESTKRDSNNENGDQSLSSTDTKENTNKTEEGPANISKGDIEKQKEQIEENICPESEDSKEGEDKPCIEKNNENEINVNGKDDKEEDTQDITTDSEDRADKNISEPQDEFPNENQEQIPTEPSEEEILDSLEQKRHSVSLPDSAENVIVSKRTSSISSIKSSSEATPLNDQKRDSISSVKSGIETLETPSQTDVKRSSICSTKSITDKTGEELDHLTDKRNSIASIKSSADDVEVIKCTDIKRESVSSAVSITSTADEKHQKRDSISSNKSATENEPELYDEQKRASVASIKAVTEELQMRRSDSVTSIQSAKETLENVEQLQVKRASIISNKSVTEPLETKQDSLENNASESCNQSVSESEYVEPTNLEKGDSIESIKSNDVEDSPLLTETKRESISSMPASSTPFNEPVAESSSKDSEKQKPVKEDSSNENADKGKSSDSSKDNAGSASKPSESVEVEEDPIAGWGKPLGLPSPIRPGTPSKHSRKAEEDSSETKVIYVFTETKFFPLIKKCIENLFIYF